MSSPSAGDAGSSAVIRLAASPYLAAAFAMLVWAGATVLVRGVHADVPPVGLSFWRTLVGAVILLPFVAGPLLAQAAAIRANIRILALLSALLFVGGNGLLYFALQFTLAINAGVINSVEPVMILGCAWLLFRDPVNRRQGFGITVSLAGVLTLISRGTLDTLAALDFNIGDIIAVFAYLSWAFYAVMLRRAPGGITPAVTLFVMLVLGSLFLLPFYVVEAVFHRPTVADMTTILSVFYLALFSSVIAVLFWNRAISALGSGRAGVFIHLIPAFTVIMAIFILGEPLRMFHISGIALIAIGIYFSSRKPGPE